MSEVRYTVWDIDALPDVPPNGEWLFVSAADFDSKSMECEYWRQLANAKEKQISLAVEALGSRTRRPPLVDHLPKTP